MPSVKLPDFDSWMELVDLAVDLACRRASGDAEATMPDFSPPANGPFAGLALDPTDELVLCVLVAHQVDRRIAQRLESLSGELELTVGALADVAYGCTRTGLARGLHPTAPLFYRRLLETPDDDGRTSVTRRRVRLADRVLAVALGRDLELHDEHLALPTALDPATLTVPPGALAEVRAAFDACGARGIVVVAGVRGRGRRTVLGAVAAEKGHRVLEVDSRKLSPDPVLLRHQLGAVVRECHLLGAVPMLCDLDAMPSREHDVLGIIETELVRRVERPILLTMSSPRVSLRWDRPVVVVELPSVTANQRADLWHRELGLSSLAAAHAVAEQYPLAPAVIVETAASIRSMQRGGSVTSSDLSGAVRAVVSEKLGTFATRVDTGHRLEDLVLDPHVAEQAQELIMRVVHRTRVHESWGFSKKVGKGLGIAAMFSGPPGTGKTMLAHVIANELALDLYQVDLSKIVSRYIGETEQRLADLFDAAESGQVALLFDEADSLFGKRTEVKSSNDRYANQETNYLLQRLETFTGVCMLTTNHDTQVDPAFKRRLASLIRFEHSDEESRCRVWKQALPATAPRGKNLDFASLARRFPMDPGHIRNAAMRAAFLAAAAASPITQSHLVRAALMECESTGRLCAA